MSEALRVLVIGDSPTMRALLLACLEKEGDLASEGVGTLREAQERLGQSAFEAALLDLTLPDASGLEALKALRAEWPALAVVVVTGAGRELEAEALREGAQDYLTKKGLGAVSLVLALRQAVARQQVSQRLLPVRQGLDATAKVIEELERIEEAREAPGP